MGKWMTPTFARGGHFPDVPEDLLDEEVVILLHGRNIFNNKVYSYLQVTLRNLVKLKQAIDDDANFMPSDFGTVLAAGKGEPSDELKAEMTATYNMAEPSRPKAQASTSFAQPTLWDEEN